MIKGGTGSLWLYFGDVSLFIRMLKSKRKVIREKELIYKESGGVYLFSYRLEAEHLLLGLWTHLCCCYIFANNSKKFLYN